MLFWLASYPRSGSNFFQTVLRDLCDVHPAFIEDCEPLVRELMGDAAADAIQAQRQAMIDRALKIGHENSAPSGMPQFSTGPQWAQRPIDDLIADPLAFMLKTHCLASESRLPAVYLVRDGRDVLVSYAKYAPRNDASFKMPPEVFRNNLQTRMCTGCPRYGNWSTNVASWIDRPNTFVLNFTDLIADPVESVKRMIDTLNLPLTLKSETPPTFEQLQATNPKLYRRGKVGSWQDEFPPDLLSVFWERHGATMQRLGFDDRKRASA